MTNSDKKKYRNRSKAGDQTTRYFWVYELGYEDGYDNSPYFLPGESLGEHVRKMYDEGFEDGKARKEFRYTGEHSYV